MGVTPLYNGASVTFDIACGAIERGTICAYSTAISLILFRYFTTYAAYRHWLRLPTICHFANACPLPIYRYALVAYLAAWLIKSMLARHDTARSPYCLVAPVATAPPALKACAYDESATSPAYAHRQPHKRLPPRCLFTERELMRALRHTPQLSTLFDAHVPLPLLTCLATFTFFRRFHTLIAMTPKEYIDEGWSDAWHAHRCFIVFACALFFFDTYVHSAAARGSHGPWWLSLYARRYHTLHIQSDIFYLHKPTCFSLYILPIFAVQRNNNRGHTYHMSALCALPILNEYIFNILRRRLIRRHSHDNAIRLPMGYNAAYIK